MSIDIEHGGILRDRVRDWSFTASANNSTNLKRCKSEFIINHQKMPNAVEI